MINPECFVTNTTIKALYTADKNRALILRQSIQQPKIAALFGYLPHLNQPIPGIMHLKTLYSYISLDHPHTAFYISKNNKNIILIVTKDNSCLVGMINDHIVDILPYVFSTTKIIRPHYTIKNAQLETTPSFSTLIDKNLNEIIKIFYPAKACIPARLTKEFSNPINPWLDSLKPQDENINTALAGLMHTLNLTDKTILLFGNGLVNNTLIPLKAQSFDEKINTLITTKMTQWLYTHGYDPIDLLSFYTHFRTKKQTPAVIARFQPNTLTAHDIVKAIALYKS